MVRQHYDYLFPDDTSLDAHSATTYCDHRHERAGAYLSIVDIVYLIEDDKLHIANEVRAFVKHAAQNLGRHDEAVRLWIDLYIAREDAHGGRRECLFEVAVLLVRECLNG